MAKTVVLSEYSTSPPVPLTATDLVLLQAVPADRLQVQPTTQTGLFTFRTSSYVGAVDLDTVRLRINPKIDDLHNVLLMFASAAGIADWSLRDSDYASDELTEGIAELVLRTIDQATRRGLIHGYQNREERSPTLRGRILVSQLAARPWEQWPVPCRYDDYTADVPENRVLLATVATVRRWTVEPAIRRLATELEERFAEVAPTDAALLEAELIRDTPLNEHYQPALALAREVLLGFGVAHSEGALNAVAFLVDMNRLFEKWIGAELSQRLWPGLQVSEQETMLLSRRPTVRMHPDLLFKTRGVVSLVGDVKYKLSGTGMARNADYYQVLAYATAADVALGILVYCQADEAPDKRILIENGGQSLTCYPLPLAGDWQQVSHAVDRLAGTIQALTSHAASTV